MLKRPRGSGRSSARPTSERGAVAVEFALTVIPLLMIVFGVLHFGFVMAQKASLNSSVRTGARYGSVNLYDSATNPHSCSNVIDKAKEGVSTLGMTGDAVKYWVYRGTDEATARAAGALCESSVAGPNDSQPPCQGSSESDNLYVRAVYQANLIGIPFVGISKMVDLESVGVYRCEYS